MVNYLLIITNNYNLSRLDYITLKMVNYFLPIDKGTKLVSTNTNSHTDVKTFLLVVHRNGNFALGNLEVNVDKSSKKSVQILLTTNQFFFQMIEIQKKLKHRRLVATLRTITSDYLQKMCCSILTKE